tara:strand:- start:4 stop:189 length:186 start_codon:yes stop_codon:yes gene_type:complete
MLPAIPRPSAKIPANTRTAGTRMIKDLEEHARKTKRTKFDVEQQIMGTRQPKKGHTPQLYL